MAGPAISSADLKALFVDRRTHALPAKIVCTTWHASSAKGQHGFTHDLQGSFRWYTTPPGMAAWLGLMRIVVAVCKLLRVQLKQRPLPWSQHTRSLHYCHGLRCAAGGQSSDVCAGGWCGKPFTCSHSRSPAIVFTVALMFSTPCGTLVHEWCLCNVNFVGLSLQLSHGAVVHMSCYDGAVAHSG